LRERRRGAKHRVEYLDLRVADTDFRVRAPQAVLGVVDRMLTHVSRETSGNSSRHEIDVRFEADLWRVSGSSSHATKTLSSTSGLPRVAGATVSSLLTELAEHRNVRVVRATAVERDGAALMMIGDDWENCVALAAHLHTRGWHILSGDYALLECDTLSALGFKKMLHANSSSVPSFPLWYRRAVEASPWYANANDIAFYAIDPTLIDGNEAWCERAPVRALLNVDGHSGDHPSLELGRDVTLQGLLQADLERGGVAVSNLVLGPMIETADFVERWFRALAPGV
jgi:hypothetical protein